MKHSRVRFLCDIMMLLCLPLAGDAEICDRLAPLPGSSYQYKERGNRCEGLYVAEVGAQTIELISLTDGELSFDLRRGVTLQVSVPPDAGEVRIRALAKPLKTYYRMDATLTAGSVLNWPVDDVLLPQSLSAERIGIFAWRTMGTEKIFAPVKVRAGASSPKSEGKALLSIRTSFDVEKLKWRSAEERQDRCLAADEWRDAIDRTTLAGEPVTLSLAGLKGRRCVDIAALPESSNDWTTLKIRVALPPQ